jgi:predicted acetyltransferase
LSLTCRKGRSDDVPAAARLGAHSFPGIGASLDDWEARFRDFPLGGVETLWVGETEGRVVAACNLYRFEQWIAGSRIPIMGLGTVAISLTHRRRGLAERLVATGLRESRERGDVASALYPFRTSFYRRLGYGIAGEVQQFRVRPRALVDDPGRERVRMVLNADDRSEIAAIYDRWAPLQTGQLARTPRAWERVFEGADRHAVLYHDPAGIPAGYLVFRYLSESARGGPAVDVEEIVWTSRDARLALHAWLASLADQWDAILYRAHPEEGFAEHLTELRQPANQVPGWNLWFPGAATLYGPMFRLVDLEGAWRVRSLQDGPPCTVALEVHDHHLEENAGHWSLRFEQGAVDVARGTGTTADLRLAIGIEPLSRIFIGSLTLADALNAGLATSDAPNAPDSIRPVDRLLSVPKPWMFDRF